MPKIKTPMQRGPPRLPVLDVDVSTGVEEGLRWHWTNGGSYLSRIIPTSILVLSWQIEGKINRFGSYAQRKNVPTTETQAEQMANPWSCGLNTVLLLVWCGVTDLWRAHREDGALYSTTAISR